MYTSTILATLLAAATAHAAVIDLRAAADFGSCTPTMDFQLGRPGRKATEGTFLPTDPAVAKGQEDALNPNIITNGLSTTVLCLSVCPIVDKIKSSPGGTEHAKTTNTTKKFATN